MEGVHDVWVAVLDGKIVGISPVRRALVADLVERSLTDAIIIHADNTPHHLAEVLLRPVTEMKARMIAKPRKLLNAAISRLPAHGISFPS